MQLHHEDSVTFATEITIPSDAELGETTLSGKLGFQTCDENGSCKAPTAADFSFVVTVADESNSEPAELTITQSSSGYDAVLALFDKKQEEAAAKSIATEVAKQPFNLKTFLGYCVMAFFAGLILNVMPCVLPVIGLKMMSFVEQSGEDRSRIFSLNIAFSLGLMTVFWALAIFVIAFGGGWGDMLNKGLAGVIIASGIVFAFGLSMIGVWEIPIPGFASSTAANKLAEKEGLGGAFSKGILTTILATPCVGPMLIPAMTFAMTQEWYVAFTLFTILGFGMAFPFVMVAFFPASIKLLPKPGPWMETFKQFMGFILIATVIFLMNTFSQAGDQAGYLLAVLTMLLAIAIGCWWIGRTSIVAEFATKAKAYAVGIAIIAGGTFLGFHYLSPSEYELDWQEYSDIRLAEIREEGTPVFIDFTGPG